MRCRFFPQLRLRDCAALPTAFINLWHQLIIISFWNGLYRAHWQLWHAIGSAAQSQMALYGMTPPVVKVLPELKWLVHSWFSKTVTELYGALFSWWPLKMVGSSLFNSQIQEVTIIISLILLCNSDIWGCSSSIFHAIKSWKQIPSQFEDINAVLITEDKISEHVNKRCGCQPKVDVLGCF